MDMSDFTYIVYGEWVAIYPESEIAIQEYDKILAASYGSGKFLKMFLPDIKQQLKKNGYSIRQTKKSSNIPDDDLLRELAE